MKSIIKTAFFVSLLSYGCFALADYVRPGFVSYVFSAHLFLIPTLILGIWLGFMEDEIPHSTFYLLPSTFKSLLSLILFILLWREGTVFGDFRLVIAACGLFLPWIAAGLARQSALGQDDDI